jgi:hypothetical protein
VAQRGVVLCRGLPNRPRVWDSPRHQHLHGPDPLRAGRFRQRRPLQHLLDNDHGQIYFRVKKPKPETKRSNSRRFSIGAESLAVAQNNYAVLWFKGKELNMVFGLQLSFARIGSTVNFWVMESIYAWVNQEYKGYQGLGIVLFVATSTCIFSMLCALILGWMDKRAETILRRHESTSGEVVRFTDVVQFKLTFWLITVICVAYYVAIFPFIGLGK